MTDLRRVMLDCFLDALIDTAKIIGILYLVYLLVSYVEHNNNHKFHSFMQKTQKAGPFMGATLGIVPQCGFSAVMSDLFAKKKITIGTLVAVFIATSDEAIPILISNPDFFTPMLILLGIKFIYAILVGYAFDGVVWLINKKKGQKVTINSTTEDCIDCNQEQGLDKHEEKHHDHEHDHEHDHKGGNCKHSKCCADNIFLDALKHTAIISAFIFLATFLINILVHYVGMEALSNALLTNSIFQPFIAAGIGLIPNCASSVLLVELFMQGGVSFGSLVAGLCAGSGVGLLILFKQNKPIWQNILILFSCYITGALLGLVICFII